jgi:hypothetical protein
MTHRKKSPQHDYWYGVLEPVVRETIKVHPRWFAFTDEEDKRAMVNSLMKRIVGQVIARADGVPPRD